MKLWNKIKKFINEDLGFIGFVSTPVTDVMIKDEEREKALINLGNCLLENETKPKLKEKKN